MKTTNKFLALALMAVATVFASCSKDDDNDPVVPTQQEIETKIVGKWKFVTKNGDTLLTNAKVVRTYYSDNTATSSASLYIDETRSYAWENKIPYTWNVEENMVCDKPVGVGVTKYDKVISIDSNQYSAIGSKMIDPQGMEHMLNMAFVAQKVTADYSQDIIGMWEGVEMTGYETYGNAEARIEYRADGTYTYYKKQGDYWAPSTNVDNEYNVDGDWLATRWRPEAGADYNYEWWDIDYIKDGMMKWSALREKEDGTRFTTTFTWKKVELPTQQEIETKIIGKWKSTMDMGMHKGEVLTNGRVIHSYNADHTGFASHSARTPEGYSWDNKSPFSFSLKGNVLSEKPEGEHIMERSFKITAIGDNSMTCELSMPAMPDEEKMPASVMTFTKVTADYSNDIIGMWEGVEMTGYETYGGIEARIEYKADGTYTYYKKVDGEWQPLADVIDEYNVDGDWLATRWQNKGSDVMNYEWWDIDYIKDGTMKWSALREKEDGTRFTTTFTWKKIKQ